MSDDKNVCPRCGSENVIIVLRKPFGKGRKCRDCGHEEKVGEKHV